VLGLVKPSLPVLPVLCQRSLQDCSKYNLFRRFGSRATAAVLWSL